MNTKSFSQCLVVVLVMAFLMAMILIPPTEAAAQSKTPLRLKIAAGHALGTDWVKFTSEFFCKEVVKRVNERTKYNLEIAEYWGGSIAKVDEVLEQTEMGLLDIGVLSTPFEPVKMSLHNFPYFIPFYTPDPRVAMRIDQKLYKQFPILKNMFRDKYNQIFLNTGGFVDYGLITTYPVRTHADIMGKKIGGAGPNLPWITGSGAVGVQVVFGEVYTSLQTGVFQGMITFPSVAVSMKFYEIAKYYADVNFGAISNGSIMTMNKQAYEKLPKEVRDIILEVSEEWHPKYTEFLVRQYEKSMAELKEKGVTIYKLPQEEKVKWAKGLVNMPKKFAKENDARGLPGTALITSAIKILKEEGHPLVRDWLVEP